MFFNILCYLCLTATPELQTCVRRQCLKITFLLGCRRGKLWQQIGWEWKIKSEIICSNLDFGSTVHFNRINVSYFCFESGILIPESETKSGKLIAVKCHFPPKVGKFWDTVRRNYFCP